LLSRCQQNEIIKWGAEAPVNEDVGVFIVTTRKRPSARSTLMAFASDSHVTNSEFIIPTQGMFSFGLFFRSPPSPPLSASLCCSLLPRPSYGATCRQQRQPYGTGCRRRRQSWTGVGRYGQDPRRPHNIVWPDPTGSVAPLTLSARVLSEALKWLDKAPKTFEAMKKFWEDHGKFTLSGPAKACLTSFYEAHGKQVPFPSQNLDPTLMCVQVCPDDG